jgi:hypothetical protein
MKKNIRTLFLIVVVFGIILVAITYAFTDDKTSVILSRSIEVNAPNTKVFEFISHTENKSKWVSNPDEKVTRNSAGQDGTVGFVRSWESQSPPKKGSELITKIVHNSSIESQIENEENGIKTVANQALSSVSKGQNLTEVTWEVEVKVPLPLLSRMLMGFATLYEKPTDENSVAESLKQGIQEKLEQNGSYTEMDNKLQRLKESIEYK